MRARMREVWKRLLEAAAGEPQYTYRPIADALKAPVVRVCLFPVVAQIGAARRSSGSDFTVTLRIVDESRKAGISATFFADNTALLPCVKSSGDVISLHDVVKRHHEEFFVTFDKKVSSFVLFESKVSAECRSYQTSVKYHGSKHDKERLTQMRMWLPLGLKDFGLKDLELQLRNLKSDSTFDLVCKVLRVLEDNGKWIFYVWDGTDTSAAELQTISDAEAVASPPLLEGPPLPREVLCTMPCVGTVLKIFFRQMYDSRNTNKVHRQPMASFPSNVADVYEKEGYSTLMESLTHDEVEFFGGFMTEEVVIKKMNKLLGVPEPEDSEEVAPLTRNPPWICFPFQKELAMDLSSGRSILILAIVTRPRPVSFVFSI
ncbi:unnamed protein product [Miscanthus lutarioriparius]|uniref:Telomeric single stranded DNA binding POT1/Cdc13 domain-containing protein n=1 Tax=Miscanthus lutarioriparius TaxID=422564 RepID=A0A811N1R0_9POAL|nr:unnamed protein product [Miscanthus lutarioriparius]